MPAFHNPDRYMADLRQIIAQGRKRIGFLVGAGAPAGILVDPETGQISDSGTPLIPVVAPLTEMVVEKLRDDYGRVLDSIKEKILNPNIEDILTHFRGLGAVIGPSSIDGLTGEGYEHAANRICNEIGAIVTRDLPEEDNPFSELIGWIGGTDRPYPIEIFTTNYDRLFEQALERSKTPFFDGFVGSHQPFFDPSTISKNDLPSRWVRLWKLHGSIGWGKVNDDQIIRTNDTKATELIYPEHLKYARTEKGPYAALFDRLRDFLSLPDTLLITIGFSFADLHIASRIEEGLAGNPSASVFAFQYGELENEGAAVRLAQRRSNISVYARDKAVINCVPAVWDPGQLPSQDWAAIRASYWGTREPDAVPKFVLGEFAPLARFFALSKSEQSVLSRPTQEEPDEG